MNHFWRTQCSSGTKWERLGSNPSPDVRAWLLTTTTPRTQVPYIETHQPVRTLTPAGHTGHAACKPGRDNLSGADSKRMFGLAALTHRQRFPSGGEYNRSHEVLPAKPARVSTSVHAPIRANRSQPRVSPPGILVCARIGWLAITLCQARTHRGGRVPGAELRSKKGLGDKV